ncbi:MAG: hypothetical protein QOE16_1032, partial [Microbacteriaceae bacterium]|nr:hypothetical protein [Microbacteriaceae bacterium]
MTIQAVVADTVSEMMDAVVALDRMASGIRGLQAQLLDQVRRVSGLGSIGSSRQGAAGRGMELRSLRAELALALRVPERTAEAQLVVAEALVHDLPDTLVALTAGEIGYRHAQIMVDHTTALDNEPRATLESSALPYARNL